MRYFIIRYLGFEYRHPEPVQTILRNGALFLSYAAAEAALPPVPYPADSETDQFPNYFTPGDETVYEKRAWFIQELSERDIISMALSQGIYSYPNWPLRAPDDIAPIWRDPEVPEAVFWWDGRRVQSMKPGRFLNRFYKDLSKIQIEYYARWWIDRQRPPREISSTVTFARTEEEMISAYARGPDSCMIGKKAPRAYAGGDFALATLEASSGEVSARVLVNEKTKTFGRIYSDEDEGEDLEELLRQMDYVSLEENTEGFEGARFLKIESSKNEYGEVADDRHMSFVMPYLDRNVYIDPLTWTATRNYQREFSLNSDGTSGVMTILKDKCAICGKLAMIQTYRHRVDHEDFGEGTALCPEHRISESYLDSYNHQRRWGTPTYTDPDGHTYSKETIFQNLYASSTGAWYLEFQDPRISVDGKVYSDSEVTALGARFSERYDIWTFKSDQELRETHEPLYIQRKARRANSDAAYNGSWYSNIANGIEYGHRSSAFGDAEVQETSGLHNGGDIYRTVPSVSIFNQAVSQRYQELVREGIIPRG